MLRSLSAVVSNVSPDADVAACAGYLIAIGAAWKLVYVAALLARLKAARDVREPGVDEPRCSYKSAH